MKSTIAAGLLALMLAWALAPVPAFAQTDSAPEQVRAIWVTRWDYKKGDDVRAIMENCAAMGFNVVLFQVRGNGTVYYPSKIEPWAWELTSDGPETTGMDPGWDPLAVAVKEAHARGLELHAYVNVFPAWRTQNYPPRDSGQLWWEHPDWFMCDAAGERMLPRDRSVNPSVGDWYSFISPGVPAVQDYLAGLFAEMAANYAIDGIHYDYIRYPAEIREVKEGYGPRARRMGNWSYDPVSLARFSHETGVTSPDTDPDAWRDWRAAQITATVRKIHAAVNAARPGVVFTAAVMADPADAYETKYQDYVNWMKEGVLDAAITMNYTGDVGQFRERSAKLLEPKPEAGIVVQGLGAGHNAEVLGQELAIVSDLGADGFAFFAYSHLFDRDAGHARKPQAATMEALLPKEKARTPWSKTASEKP